MYCKYCGAEIQEGNKFCTNCGKPVNDSSILEEGEKIKNDFTSTVNTAEKALGDAVEDVKNSFNGSNTNSTNYSGYGSGERLKDDRGLLSYILLSIITFGIYSWYFIYKMAHDVNIACEGDGDSTMGLVGFILLSIITCGIYGLIWEYRLGNRLCSNAPRYGYHFQENGTTVLLWDLLGSLLCGIGCFVAMNILIRNSNLICGAYNREHGYN